MSNTDSFIDEVNEEVRSDRLYALMRRYGWIPALLIVLLVAGAAWNEYRKAQERAAAEAFGDQMLAAVSIPQVDDRAAALEEIVVQDPAAEAVLGLLTASQLIEAQDTDGAIAALNRVATLGEVPAIYRQIANFKALTLQTGSLPAEDRRQQFEALAQPGMPLRLLAEEQLALIDIETGNRNGAIDRLQSILADAEVTSDLQQRALQVIVALGGTPDLSRLTTPTR